MFSEAITSRITDMRFRSLALASAAGLTFLSACGGGSESSSETLPADVDVVVNAVEGINWDKQEYTAAAGPVKVATTNLSSLPHNLRIVDPSGTQLPNAFDIPARNSVAIDTVSLETGTYTLICTIAGHNNMRSTLVVS
jgi:plastocyanin